MVPARRELTRPINRRNDVRLGWLATGIGFEVHKSDLPEPRAELDAFRLNRPDGVHHDGGDYNDDDQDQHDGTLPQPLRAPMP